MPTPKGSRRRDEILSAAVSLLISEGAEAVSHRAVARRADIGLGTVTYHYPAVDDLRGAAMLARADADVERMRQARLRVPLTRRDARDAAALVVTLLLPETRLELIAWCEAYVRDARAPGATDGARRVRGAARALVSDVLGRSGRATAPPADLVLAIVDGAVLGALADGEDLDRIRARATAALAFVLHDG
ncbi:TetR/AcrR family transcriptional regulator [Paraconexibacter sp.]|uniref:TetR/AcrR family transcriptional regulator n=1 Tax=Paraconexibacter sp. TaxID=2949640 RepID=UPI0035638899